MGSSGYNCIRSTFCWFNVLIWICSCAFLGAGLWLRITFHGYSSLLPENITFSADTLFLGIGAIGFLLSFFGCCGSWVESRCFLCVYIFLIIMLFMSEFLVGAIAFAFRSALTRTLSNELRFGIENHYNASDRGSLASPSVASIWDNIQQNFECCGVTSYEDWYNIKAWSGKNWVPNSCCKRNINAFQVEGSGDFGNECWKSENPELWFDKGCVHSFQNWIVKHLHVVGTIGLVIASIQLIGLLCSMLLFCSVKRRSKRSPESYKSYSPSSADLHSKNVTSWED
ncbi:hypothetical protein ACFFRR_011385 [Megaselia abdita]